MMSTERLWQYASQYYGVDWAIAIAVFAGIFLLGEKKKEGFILGMLSSLFGIVFSVQIGSIANGVTSIVLFFLYLRGYLRWVISEQQKKSPVLAA